jgi:hypothetical protein
MIARFIYVVLPLAALYKLPTTSLNIFYDPTGSCIAFNLKASIFLNLRFFEAWREYASTFCGCILSCLPHA